MGFLFPDPKLTPPSFKNIKSLQTVIEIYGGFYPKFGKRIDGFAY